MSSAEKFELFLKICAAIFVLLFTLKIMGVVDINWLFVFLPIIVPGIMILIELGVFK